MKDSLSIACIKIVDSASSWEDAIYAAVEPLAKSGYVEPRYADEIIKNAHEFGPYFIIAPKVALLHARPEQGAIKQQLSVSVLRKPIRFLRDERDVYLLITLAATDTESHIDVMRDLAGILIEPGRIDAIINAKTPEEVFKLMTK